MARRVVDPPELLTPAEVAAMFGVEVRTIARWARNGQLPAVRTIGGHRRYPAAEVRQLMESTAKGER
jgi:excisionase family DNA binding protein